MPCVTFLLLGHLSCRYALSISYIVMSMSGPQAAARLVPRVVTCL
jgi:hypothetical protein